MKKIETERKYIIKRPDYALIASQPSFTESVIEQIYLADSGKTHRVRRREYSDGSVEYTENTKERISLLSSKESERSITEDEYRALAVNIEDGASPLLKRRLTFEYEGKIFELDIYPQWQASCIMEIELDSELEGITMPPFIEILAEVTGKKEYSNHSMAHKFPDEISG